MGYNSLHLGGAWESAFLKISQGGCLSMDHIWEVRSSGITDSRGNLGAGKLYRPSNLDSELSLKFSGNQKNII